MGERVLDYLSSLEKRILELIDFESRAQKGGLRKADGGAYLHETPGTPVMPTPKRSASVFTLSYPVINTRNLIIHANM
jgi:hypothetical protein